LILSSRWRAIGFLLITFDTTLGVAGESVERARDVNSPFELIELDTYTPLPTYLFYTSLCHVPIKSLTVQFSI